MFSSSTLSSDTADNSSASSALSEGKPHEGPPNNMFAAQLKNLPCRVAPTSWQLLLSHITTDVPFAELHFGTGCTGPLARHTALVEELVAFSA
jgi:hypothetical protein